MFLAMSKAHIFISLLAATTLLGCSRREEAEPTVVDQPTAAAPLSEVEAEKLVPKATIAPVKVSVTLSPAAQALLNSKSEKISVIATYSGDPMSTEQAQKMTDPISGMIKLGESQKILDGAGSLVFQDDVIDKSRLDSIVGEIQLTLNVTSTKSSGAENLLACPFYWKPLAEASKESIRIDCTTFQEATK